MLYFRVMRELNGWMDGGKKRREEKSFIMEITTKHELSIDNLSKREGPILEDDIDCKTRGIAELVGGELGGEGGLGSLERLGEMGLDELLEEQGVADQDDGLVGARELDGGDKVVDSAGEGLGALLVAGGGPPGVGAAGEVEVVAKVEGR